MPPLMVVPGKRSSTVGHVDAARVRCASASIFSFHALGVKPALNRKRAGVMSTAFFADLVGRVHEQVVDRRVAGAPALGLFLVGRVADDDVELLAHGQCPSVSMSSTIFCRSSGVIRARFADPEVAGVLDPRLALRDAAGDGLDGDAVQDLVVAHLEDL